MKSLVPLMGHLPGDRAIRLFASFALVLVALSGCQSPQAIPVSFPLRSPLLRGFEIAEQANRRDSTLYTLTNATSILKVEVVAGLDRDSAQRIVEDGAMNIEALYANALSPYPGDISNRVVSERRFLPRRFSARNGEATGFLLFANDRLGYGATTTGQVKFKSVAGWIHCDRRGDVFKVRYFAPVETDDRAMQRFFLALRCQ